jgi:hypothetical protein
MEAEFIIFPLRTRSSVVKHCLHTALDMTRACSCGVVFPDNN